MAGGGLLPVEDSGANLHGNSAHRLVSVIFEIQVVVNTFEPLTLARESRIVDTKLRPEIVLSQLVSINPPESESEDEEGWFGFRMSELKGCRPNNPDADRCFRPTPAMGRLSS